MTLVAKCFGLTGLGGFGNPYLGLQPRLSYCGLSALDCEMDLVSTLLEGSAALRADSMLGVVFTRSGEASYEPLQRDGSAREDPPSQGFRHRKCYGGQAARLANLRL